MKILVHILILFSMSSCLKIAFVAAIAMVSGINVFSAQKSVTLSDVALANVEALAQGESSDSNCFWDSDEYVTCDKNGRHTGCPYGSHEW